MNRNDIDSFIQNHEHECYCEAILFDDGTISYAIPSHNETLIRIAMERDNITRNELDKAMPIEASPVHWLTEHLNCSSLWFNSCISCNLTELQKESLIKLQKAGVIANNYIIDISIEKTLLDLRAQDKIDEISNLERKSFILLSGEFMDITK